MCTSFIISTLLYQRQNFCLKSVGNKISHSLKKNGEIKRKNFRKLNKNKLNVNKCSLFYDIKSACLQSGVWGFFNHFIKNKYAADEMFPLN